MGKSRNSKYYIEDDEFEHTDHKRIFQESRQKRKDKEKVRDINISEANTEPYWKQ